MKFHGRYSISFFTYHMILILPNCIYLPNLCISWSYTCSLCSVHKTMYAFTVYKQMYMHIWYYCCFSTKLALIRKLGEISTSMWYSVFALPVLNQFCRLIDQISLFTKQTMMTTILVFYIAHTSFFSTLTCNMATYMSWHF